MTRVLVPVYMRWRRTDLLYDSAMVGGETRHSAGCYWTSFRLANEAKNKLASWIHVELWKTLTTLQRCTLHIYAVLLVEIRCMLPLVLTGFLFFFFRLSSTNLCCSGSKTPSIMHRLFRSVQVQLRCIHAGVIGLPIALSGCVSSTLRNLNLYDFSRTDVVPCLLKVQF